MEPEQTKSLEFHEVEVKFKVEEGSRNEWKQLVEKIPGCTACINIESDDIYYTKGNKFLRYRFDPKSQGERAELTFKSKLNKGNNIIRKEVNLRVDPNTPETVEAFATGLGYKHNFRISKYVDIYRFDDVILPFYTVIDENGDRQTFLEIEINEDKIHNLTQDQCWDIIRKYEAILAPLGIRHNKRLKKSLFEMYRKGEKF